MKRRKRTGLSGTVIFEKSCELIRAECTAKMGKGTGGEIQYEWELSPEKGFTLIIQPQLPIVYGSGDGRRVVYEENTAPWFMLATAKELEVMAKTWAYDYALSKRRDQLENDWFDRWRVVDEWARQELKKTA